MRVLLTGASGFIGRYVLQQLTVQGIDVVVVGRSRPFGFDGDFIEADLLKLDDFAILVGRASATHLLHLAWYAEHGKFWSSPLNLRWVESSVRLTEAFCTAGGKRVVGAGSCAEYDWSYGYCREDHTPQNPTTLYGTAKDVTRRLMVPVCFAAGVSFAWARVFFLYGKGEDARRLIPSLIDVFQRKREPFGVNAKAYRDFLHVEDVARGFVMLLLSEATGSYNISSNQPIQIAEVVRLIANALECDPNLVFDLSSERPGEPDVLIGDSKKLKGLGWQPCHQIEGIIANLRIR